MESDETFMLNAPDDLGILTTIISELKKLDSEERSKMIQMIEIYFGGRPSGTSILSTTPTQNYSDRRDTANESSFSEDRSLSPKQFIMQKQPRTDVERIACLAYYLTHYRDTPHFKTADLSKLNTEAAQPKFSNAAVAVDNATKSGYLVPATKGHKQLSAPAENFVQALPDRETAKTAMTAGRPRRTTRKKNIRRKTENSES